MRLLNDTRAATPATKLIVFLPGVYNLPEDFISQGFVAEIRKRNIDADVIMADAHFAYYEDRTVTDRLHQDLVIPAQAKGYREIWFVGISLGGYGALAYAAEHPQILSGIFLIAPYPGPQDVLKEIRAQGGPLVWARSEAANGQDERRFWKWLVDHQAKTDARPTIFFGTGESDRFIKDQRMMAELIPAERRRFVPGGHDWPAWQALWRSFLDSAPLK